jgi:Na+/H+ antiporter NhaC
MFRELATLLVVIFAAVLYYLVAGPMLTPLSEEVKQGDIDGIDGASAVDNVLSMAYLYVPLFAVGGTLLWVVFRAFRQERRVGSGGGGFG